MWKSSLFPITTQGYDTKNSGFIQQGNLDQGSKDLDWLTNTSFVPQSEETTRVESKAPIQDTGIQSPSTEATSSGNVHIIDVSSSGSSGVHSDHDELFADDINVNYEKKTSSVVHEKDDSDGSMYHKKAKKRKHTKESHGSSHKKRKKEKEGENSKKKKKKKKKKTHGEHEDRKDKKARRDTTARDRELEAVVPQHHPSKVFYDDIEDLKPEHAFRFDRKADENNIAYGSIYKMHIATRHLVSKLCLGPAGEPPVFIGESKEKKLVYKSRYFYKENVKWIKQQSIIDLSRSGDSKPRDSIDHIQAQLKDQTEDFLAFGDAPLTQGDEPENSLAKDTMGFDAVKSKVEYYNRTLRLDPHDVAHWLKWVDFQPKCVEFDTFARNKEEVEKRKPLQNSVIDLQLAILEKAIEKNPSSVELVLKRLEIGREVWDKEILLKQWKSLLFQYPNRATLWKEYLHFRRSHLHTFTVSGCLKAYTKCLDTLRRVVSGEMASHPPRPNTEYQMIGIFADMCRMVWSSGHTEKATAMYQAALEFNLHCPAVLAGAAHGERAEFLEAFWGSTAPRLGDDEATGWHVWVARKGDVVAHVPCSSNSADESFEEDLIKRHADDTTGTWINLETARRCRQWFPWRPNMDQGETEEDCEDPDRLVLADDVTAALFTVLSDEMRFEFVCQFLHLLGVPAPHLRDIYSDINLIHSDGLLDAYESISLVSYTKQGLSQFQHLPKFILNVISQSAHGLNDPFKTILLKIAVKYKSYLLTFCEQNCVKKEGKELKKWTKGLLKEEANRNNLFLWEELSNVDWQLGNHDDALKVIYTAISLSLGNITDKKPEDLTLNDVAFCRLFASFVEKLLRISDKSRSSKAKAPLVDSLANKKSARLLCCLAIGEHLPPIGDLGKSNLSPILILRAKNAFKTCQTQLVNHFHGLRVKASAYSFRDYVLVCTYGSILSVWVKCHAYFVYCTESFRAATEMYRSSIWALKYESSPNEINADSPHHASALFIRRQFATLHKDFVTLCQHHLDSNPVPFGTLRQPLTEALDGLEGDPELLRLYVTLEGRAGYSRELRRYFHRVASTGQGAVVWLFAAVAELLRSQYIKQATELSGEGVPGETGLSHQVRAWFERGVSHPRAKFCGLLWRLYSLFEKEQGNLSQSEAVLYRALQHCPASKDLYVDLIKLCPIRLAEVIDMLTEKELRLRTPHEELVLLTKASGQLGDKDVAGSGPEGGGSPVS